ncbi:ABC transporter permease [Bosea sp. CCNWLW174]|uniref:ABC transporter permease n=1 Tax=unclassified Bosea (in: a-proteobacteria) TaxID=2653178 RepID=UPI0030151C7C
MTVSAQAAPRRLDPALVAVVGLLAFVVATGFLVSERFGTLRNFTNALEQAAALGFVSLGQTLVVLAGGIDLSIGALVSALTVMISTLCHAYPDLAPLIILLALLVGAAVGAFNAGVTLALRVHPLIVTIGTAVILNGLTLMVTRQPTGSAPIWLEEFAFGRVLGLPVAGVAMLVAFTVVGLWLARHPHGRRIYAVGGSLDAARLTGIPVRRTTVLVYAASGMLAALAAIYYVARTGTGDPLVGEPLTLASITPVVVGGTLLGGGKGGVVGTLLGVFLISFLNNLLNYMNVSTFLQWVVQGLIIIAAVSFQARSRGRP